MSEKKPPHEQMTDKNNGLTSAQEGSYQQVFNKADKTAKEEDDMRTKLKKD